MTQHMHCYRQRRLPLDRCPNLSKGNLMVENFFRSCRRNRRGTAAVEFALVAPVFFLLVFGMIEYGRMVMVQQVITNASREGRASAFWTAKRPPMLAPQ